MALKSTDPACPISAFGLLCMPTARTLATCSSFGASEARDVSLFRFVGEVGDIFAIFPQRQTLVMMPATMPIAHAMRVADEQRSYLLLDTKIDRLPCGFMAQVAHAPFYLATCLVLGTLQFLPTAGIFGTTGLLLR